VLHGDVLIKDVKNCYLNGDHHLVVALGVKDLIVVDTPDATLVSDIKYSQNVKEIAAELLLKKRSEYKEHRKVYRPWGWYDSIESGEYFKVKKLHVNPGGKLSLQFHEKRAEHWIVVEGVAIVIKSNESFVLNEGESTFIPAKEVHSLKNDSDEPLVLIEVQSGTYLEEDDITRLDDIYGRNGVNIK